MHKVRRGKGETMTTTDSMKEWEGKARKLCRNLFPEETCGGCLNPDCFFCVSVDVVNLTLQLAHQRPDLEAKIKELEEALEGSRGQLEFIAERLGCRWNHPTPPLHDHFVCINESVKKLETEHDSFQTQAGARKRECFELQEKIKELEATIERIKVDPQERPMFLEKIKSLEAQVEKAKQATDFVRYIENHLEDWEFVICKICGKNIGEISPTPDK